MTNHSVKSILIAFILMAPITRSAYALQLTPRSHISCSSEDVMQKVFIHLSPTIAARVCSGKKTEYRYVDNRAPLAAVWGERKCAADFTYKENR